MLPRKKLEALAWKHTHRDFRGTWKQGEDGEKTVRTVLKFVPGVGTCAVALSTLTDAELIAKLPRAVREQHGL